MFRVDTDCMKIKMILLEDYITFILLKYIHNYICLHRETKNQFMNLVLQFAVTSVVVVFGVCNTVTV